MTALVELNWAKLAINWSLIGHCHKTPINRTLLSQLIAHKNTPINCSIHCNYPVKQYARITHVHVRAYMYVSKTRVFERA